MVAYESRFIVYNRGDTRDIVVEVFYGWGATTYWYILFDTPKNDGWDVKWYGNYDLNPGTYYAYAKAWESFSGGSYANDMEDGAGNKVGEQWWNCTGVGAVLDEETDTFSYSPVAAVDITSFNITVPYVG